MAWIQRLGIKRLMMMMLMLMLVLWDTQLKLGYCDNDDNYGPLFKVEPPLRLDFSNSTQSTVDCVADGNPVPALTWITPEGNPVRDVPKLRYSFDNGTLVFPAFRAEDYRQDVHAAIYHCLASSPAGRIRSRPLHVRAVVNQYYEVQVYDEFVIVGNTAVLKCNIPTFVKDYVAAVEWIKSGSTILHSSVLGESRYVLTSSGELYINAVETSDSHDTYRCRTIHRLSGELRLSSPARIIVSDPQSSVPPRITHSVPIIQAQQGQTIEMPCSAQGQPTPTFRWVKEDGKELIPVQLNKRIHQINGILIVDDAQVSESGTYLCIAFNNIGEEKTETILRITVPLKVTVDPSKVSLDVGKSTTLNCVVKGYPVLSISWLKDGQPLMFNERLRLLTQYILRIEGAEREDQGLYQCFARNNDEVAHGIAVLKLGDVAPIFHETFETKVLQPGSFVMLRCSASGNPTPEIRWFLDDTLVEGNNHILVKSELDVDGMRVSYLNLSGAAVHTAGDYQCEAFSRAGSLRHTAKIDVFGPPFIRSMKDVTAVAGGSIFVPCRASGYPINSLNWEKDGILLPVDRRQMVYENGTLFIENVDRALDGGIYTCIAKNKGGDIVRQSLSIKVTVPPIIDAMSFPQVLVLRVGARARLQCVVTQGDLPISISWLKDGQHLNSRLNVQLRKDDEFSSVLTFPSITTAHNGNYTCFASNSGGATNVTAQLVIEVPPRWVLQPMDTSIISGGNVTMDCKADGYPTPIITWKKALGRQPNDYRDASLTSFRVRVLSNGTIHIVGATDEDEGQYLCEAYNGIGAGVNKVVVLKVHASANFGVKFQNRTAKKGDIMVLQCDARGDSPIFISWTKNNMPLKMEQYSSRLKKSDHSLPHGLLSELTFSKVERYDEGVYRCKTWNTYGRDESVIQLTIKEPPELPDNVKIIDHGSRVVKLLWSHPFSGGSNILDYIIQYKRASEEWKPQLPNVTVHGFNSSAIIRGLLPGTPYSFRIFARNIVGISQPSNGVGITTAEEAPSGYPLNIRASSVGSEALLLTWMAPQVELSNGDILGYYVGYKVLNSTDSYQYFPMEINKGTTGDIQLKLAQLQKFTKYSIAIQAFNRMGKGPFSPEVIASTDEDVPEKAPESVYCWGVSAHSVNVTWLPPPKEHQHGAVVGYKVFYSPVSNDESKKQSKSVVKVTRLQATIHGLEQYTNYSVRALAYTRIGDGSSSDPVFCNTLEDVPGPPEEIKVLVKSQTEVVVAWKNPVRPNGPVMKYTVYMRQPQDRTQATKRFTVDSHRSMLEISGLKENQRYEFWVTASTTVGEGQSTKVVSQTPRTQVSANVATFPTTVMQSWNTDVTLPCPALGNPLPRREWRKGSKRLSPTSASSVDIAMDGSLVLSQVRRSDSGNYSCYVENTHGKDEITFQVYIQAPPEPPNAIVLQTTASSIQLSWKPEDDGGSIIKGFYIHYKKEFGEWEEVKVERDVTTYTLQSLQCGTNYQITLSSFNKIGPGRQSEVIVARTKGAEPGVPKVQDVLFPNVSYAVLRLASWPTGGCPIHYFVLQYKHTFQREWSLISNNVQRQHEYVLISDLKPGEKYDLMVTAHNDAGSTVAKYEFMTHFGMINQQKAASSNSADNQIFYEDITVIIPIVSCAITLIIFLFGVCIIIRRRRYTGYRHTNSNLDRKQELPNLKRSYDQQAKNNISKEQATDGTTVGAQNISPYATSNLQGYMDEDRAYSLQLKTFGHQELNQHPRQDSKSPAAYSVDKYSSVIRRCSNRNEEAKSRGIVLRPQHYPSAEDMYPTRSAAPEQHTVVNTPTRRNQMFLLLEKKYGSDWDMRAGTPPGSINYMSQSSPKLPEQTQVPDLLYRGTTDSSTPNDSSPEEFRLSQCGRLADVLTTNNHSFQNGQSRFPLPDSSIECERLQRYNGLTSSSPGTRFFPMTYSDIHGGQQEEFIIKV